MCPDTYRAATTECQYPGCTKPVWRDPDGSYSSFCGNTHRLAMANNPRSQSGTCKVGQHITRGVGYYILTLCSKNCNAKPVYIENGRGLCSPYSAGCIMRIHEWLTLLAHEFCGKRCADEFNNNGRRPSRSRSSPPPRENMCTIPGCRNRAFVDADGKATKYCSQRHRLYVSWLVAVPKLF